MNIIKATTLEKVNMMRSWREKNLPFSEISMFSKNFVENFEIRDFHYMKISTITRYALM